MTWTLTKKLNPPLAVHECKLQTAPQRATSGINSGGVSVHPLPNLNRIVVFRITWYPNKSKAESKKMIMSKCSHKAGNRKRTGNCPFGRDYRSVVRRVTIKKMGRWRSSRLLLRLGSSVPRRARLLLPHRSEGLEPKAQVGKASVAG